MGAGRTPTKASDLPDLEPVVTPHLGGVDDAFRRHLSAAERQDMVEALARRFVREVWDGAAEAAQALRFYEHDRRLKLRR